MQIIKLTFQPFNFRVGGCKLCSVTLLISLSCHELAVSSICISCGARTELVQGLLQALDASSSSFRCVRRNTLTKLVEFALETLDFLVCGCKFRSVSFLRSRKSSVGIVRFSCGSRVCFVQVLLQSLNASIGRVIHIVRHLRAAKLFEFVLQLCNFLIRCRKTRSATFLRKRETSVGVIHFCRSTSVQLIEILLQPVDLSICRFESRIVLSTARK